MTLGFLHVSLQIIAQSVLPASGNMPKLAPSEVFTFICGTSSHICSQLRLENQTSVGLHTTATLPPETGMVTQRLTYVKPQQCINLCSACHCICKMRTCNNALNRVHTNHIIAL